jgi:hypothetical protein
VHSQFGLVLFDQQTFSNRSFSVGDPQIDTTMASYGTSNPEYGEEQWLDQNATPVLINRYNGTVVRSE